MATSAPLTRGASERGRIGHRTGTLRRGGGTTPARHSAHPQQQRELGTDDRQSGQLALEHRLQRPAAAISAITEVDLGLAALKALADHRK